MFSGSLERDKVSSIPVCATLFHCWIKCFSPHFSKRYIYYSQFSFLSPILRGVDFSPYYRILNRSPGWWWRNQSLQEHSIIKFMIALAYPESLQTDFWMCDAVDWVPEFPLLLSFLYFTHFIQLFSLTYGCYSYTILASCLQHFLFIVSLLMCPLVLSLLVHFRKHSWMRQGVFN